MTRPAHGTPRILVHGALVVMSLIAVVPILLGAMNAFKSERQLRGAPAWSLPDPWTLENFVEVLAAPQPFGRALLITLAATVALLVVQLPLSFLAAYAIAIERPRGGRVLIAIVVIALFIPLTALVVPLYLMLARAGLAETFGGILAPFLLFSPWAVLLFVRSLRSLPPEFVDAARLDGANRWQTLRFVAVPFSHGAIVVVAMVTVVAQWGAFLWPLTIAGGEWPVVTVAVAQLQTPYVTDQPLLLAAAAFGTAPMLLLLLLAHRPMERALTTMTVT